MIALIMMLITGACEKTTIINNDDQEPLIQMYGILSTAGNENKVKIKLSLNDRVVKAPNARLSVTVDGKPMTVSEYGDGIFSIHGQLASGSKIKMVATADGMHPATAEVEMPCPAVEIVNPEVEYSVKHSQNDLYDKLKFRIPLRQTCPGRHYYKLSIQERHSFKGVNNQGYPIVDNVTDSYKNISTIDKSNEPLLNDGRPPQTDSDDYFYTSIPNDFNTFTNSAFDDGSAVITVGGMLYSIESLSNTIRIFKEGDNDEGHIDCSQSLRIVVETISPSTYHYCRVYDMIKGGEYEEALTEPLVVPCNIEGGIGFIGVATAVEFVFPERRETYPE